MTLALLRTAVHAANLQQHDQSWYPRWGLQYARFPKVDEHSNIPVAQDLAIEFLKQLKARQRPAWQRLQAIRALEFYRTEVLDEGVAERES
jgi:hypothetical protein